MSFDDAVVSGYFSLRMSKLFVAICFGLCERHLLVLVTITLLAYVICQRSLLLLGLMRSFNAIGFVNVWCYLSRLPALDDVDAA